MLRWAVASGLATWSRSQARGMLHNTSQYGLYCVHNAHTLSPRSAHALLTPSSGAGKTQLLLTLLLAAQLLPPQGLSKPVIYISTEAALATTRLTQLLATHPALVSVPPTQQPSLSHILSIQLPDLESQDHILRYQLPVAIQKHGVGLVIIDSVAANYRAEFEKKGEREGAASMAKRGAQLVQLGALLRDIARTEGVAIVVANQVADRFSRPSAAPTSNFTSRTPSGNSQGTTASISNPLSRNTSATSQGDAPRTGASTPTHQQSEPTLISAEPLTLDHQQRWTTGWGDDPSAPLNTLKTPSLGLVWTNQLACRIALHKEPVYSGRPLHVTVNGEHQWNDEETHISSWRRWFKVVFCPWAAPTEGRGVEFEVAGVGVRHVAEAS
ncbi:P-loop containing nucleoside triphosphate hydrolase protein [Amniculicola lignicola CBS 123094]|uniref:P-loop containing nucleoside triphosphate hydrolase protein n=1 Tax=Amniculicola lignicola CBS 123094 TaxID=1392246 RepID=A0A6A5WME1_9PLEO|nr:P-loop containing nucleoside triphosphate hydrolase protein [Amniculicola lignicola CBS 123094]